MSPRRDVTSRRASLFKEVLKATKCKSVDCLRDAPANTLTTANKHLLTEVVGGSGGATFGPGIRFGPIPDGEYIPDVLTVLFSQGRVNPRVEAILREIWLTRDWKQHQRSRSPLGSLNSCGELSQTQMKRLSSEFVTCTLNRTRRSRTWQTTGRRMLCMGAIPRVWRRRMRARRSDMCSVCRPRCIVWI